MRYKQGAKFWISFFQFHKIFTFVFENSKIMGVSTWQIWITFFKHTTASENFRDVHFDKIKKGIMQYTMHIFYT